MYRIIFILLSALLTGFLVRPVEDVRMSTAHTYPEQLPGTFTGGFGEETCNSCHFDYPLNPEEGKLTVKGIPSSYEPGQPYTFTIKLGREDLGKAGFQLSARHADSTQAGSFVLDSERIERTRTGSRLQYIQHSPRGTNPTDSNIAQWTITWEAPSQGSGRVIFNLAANAANGDASEFGDYIFVREFTSQPEPTD